VANQEESFMSRLAKFKKQRSSTGFFSYQGEENDHDSWSVSYTDLLMVLMSFFIIFFSYGDEKLSKEKAIGALKGNAGTITKVKEGLNSRAPASLNLKERVISVREEEIKVLLGDNIYSPGEYKMNEIVTREILEVWKAIEPYKEQVELTVVGHTDTTAFRENRRFLVDSNLILSSIRATKAAEFFVEKGLPLENINTRGLDDKSRNSRSLSLVIKGKKQ
jgi:flagellar motor protein MotB